MEYLSPKFNKYKFNLLRNYDYHFLDFINESFNIKIIYNFLLTINDYKLKNIWNLLVQEWNNLNKKDKKYKNTSYDYYHNLLDDKSLEELFNNFIDNDPFKALFTIIIIQKFI